MVNNYFETKDYPMTKCSACGEKIKEGVFESNFILMPRKNAIINEYHSEKTDQRCQKCGEELYAKYKNVLLSEREALIRGIQEELPSIPILSLHSPLHWDYSVLGLVTAQSTTGTGVFSEFTSLFTDFFGAQSKAYNQKLKAGEELCKNILRKEALDLGGNAILATDIDYAEVGASKGMLMVCMTGTAIRLKNSNILEEIDLERSFLVLKNLKLRLDYLSQYRLPESE